MDGGAWWAPSWGHKELDTTERLHMHNENTPIDTYLHSPAFDNTPNPENLIQTRLVVKSIRCRLPPWPTTLSWLNSYLHHSVLYTGA